MIQLDASRINIVYVCVCVFVVCVRVCVCVCVSVCLCVCVYDIYIYSCLIGDNVRLHYLMFCLLKCMLTWFLSYDVCTAL